MRFLNLPDELSAAAARYAVLPVPYDGTTSYRGGTRLGPAAILDASQQVELFDEELLFNPSEAGVYTAQPVRPDVTGPEAVVRQVTEAARPLLADGKFLISLGGEHSITTGLVRAVLETSPRDAGPLGVLQIDAHADLRDQYGGSPFSHGCVMRRLHQDLALAISPVGIRSFSQAEHEYMVARRIEPVTPAMIAADAIRHEPGEPAGLPSSLPSSLASWRPSPLPAWVRRALDRLPQRVYLTVDVDGLDPAVAPGTGTPEPGGLTWSDVIALVRAAFASKTVVAADIVEVSPIPGQPATEYLAARLAYKLIAYREAARRTSAKR